MRTVPDHRGHLSAFEATHGATVLFEAGLCVRAYAEEFQEQQRIPSLSRTCWFQLSQADFNEETQMLLYVEACGASAA